MFFSPDKRNIQQLREHYDYETGFRTPEISKGKLEQVMAKREKIGTMSSFFKRTTAMVSSQSERNSSKLRLNIRRVRLAIQDQQLYQQHP